MNDIELKIEHRQQLNLSQRMIQSLKLLQMDQLELSEYINQQMLENPVLEEFDPETENNSEIDIVTTEELSERIEEYESYWEEEKNFARESIKDLNFEKETANYEQYVSDEGTLYDHLMQQLRMSGLRGEAYSVAEYLIECIGEDGYLELDDGVILQDASISSESLTEARSFIKTLDPVGVGASDLRECLLWQLEALGVSEGPLYEIVDRYLVEMADNKVNKLSRELHASVSEVQELFDEIKRLDPWPARNYRTDRTIGYIVPDLLVTRSQDGYSIEYISRHEPSLRISPYYRDVLLKSKNDDEVKTYLANKISLGELLIYNINKRRETIMKVAAAVVEMQGEFVKDGEQHIRPMRLKDVANAIGMHESTVSRAINGKYIQTEHGIYELKNLFSTGLLSGEEKTSTTEIRNRIKEMILGENANDPLSDQEIADHLKNDGIEVSRRAVAKYREQMGIPTSYKRRRY